MKADNLLAGGRSQRFFPPLSASGNLSLLCLLNTSQGENSMPSSTPFFRRLLVVIKQTAYEEYSQVGLLAWRRPCVGGALMCEDSKSLAL